MVYLVGLLGLLCGFGCLSWFVGGFRWVACMLGLVHWIFVGFVFADLLV